MADFYQNGIITTLHNLTCRSYEDLEAELETFAKATPGVSQSGSSNLGSMLSSLMGLGAKGKLEDIYRENRDYNKMIMDEAYGRSLPKGVTGPAGKVSFDEETEEMLMELDPEIQGVMDGWLRAEQRAGHLCFQAAQDVAHVNAPT